MKNSLYQYAVCAEDDGEKWYAAVFFSCLQADDILFHFVVVQQIQNFEVKTGTISQSYQHLN